MVVVDRAPVILGDPADILLRVSPAAGLGPGTIAGDIAADGGLPSTDLDGMGPILLDMASRR